MSHVDPPWPDERVPRGIAELIRPHIAAVAVDIAGEIQAQIPEYARPADDNYNRAIRIGVEEALNQFVAVLDGEPGARHDTWREIYRALGAGEVREGRSLDSLQAALRVGARVAWRRLIELAERKRLPIQTLGQLAEATFLYLDEIAAASAEGYAEAQATEAGELDRRRRRLVELLLADPPAAPEAVSAAAGAARWQVPRKLSVVLLDEPVAGLRPLPPDVLSNLDRAEPCLIVADPDRSTQARAQIGALVKNLGAGCAAVGPAVAPHATALSLRWAQKALGLARRGVLRCGPDPVVWCADHLGTLVMFGDEDLLAILAERRLAPLEGLRAASRDLLADTLLAWLQLDRNANEVAAKLHVHPQTVRYRLRQLDRLFGDQLRDAELRFELEIALRTRLAVKAPTTVAARRR